MVRFLNSPLRINLLSISQNFSRLSADCLSKVHFWLVSICRHKTLILIFLRCYFAMFGRVHSISTYFITYLTLTEGTNRYLRVPNVT